MSLRRLSLVLIVAFVAQAQTTKIAKIQEIFKLTNVDGMQKRMVDQITASMPAQLQQMGGTPEQQAQAVQSTNEMTKLIFDRMSWAKMEPLYTRVYDETFTEDEISGMLLFYQSPAGQALNAKMPALMTKVIAISQEQMKTLMPEIQKMTQDSMKSQKNDKL